MTARADAPGWLLGVQLLFASRALFDELHRRLAAAGHNRLRPPHGFLFQALGPDGATASIFDELRDEVAAELGPAGLIQGLQLLAAIESRFGPVPLRPVW